MLIPFSSLSRRLCWATCCLFLSLCGAIAGPGAGAPHIDLRSDAFMTEARQAFESIYNLDYDEAERSLAILRGRFPEHPAPPLYLATVLWLRELFGREELDLDHFVAPGYFKEETDRKMPARQREAFFQYLDESRDKSQAVLEADPNNPDARYLLGARHGILASFAITIDRRVGEAFDHGKQAYKLHRRLIDEDPEYFDAYMSVGMYEYIVGSIPWYIKWIARLVGYSGSKERGFEYLGIAAKKGTYVRDDALTLQMVLFIREKRPADALANAQTLFSKYPKNFLLDINQAQILEMLGRNDQAAARFQEILGKAERKLPNYRKLPLAKFRLAVARKLEEFGRDEEARAQLERLLASAETPERERTLGHLLLAEYLVSADRPREARQHFEAVLKAPPQGDSHSKARAWLEKQSTGDGR